MKTNQAIKNESAKLKHEIKKGEVLFQGGNTDEAEKHFFRLLAEDPLNTEILNNLGVINHAKGKIKNSEDYFLKALSSDENNPDALLNLADLYLEQRRYEETANRFEQYAANVAKDHNILNRLGQIYLNMNDAAKAKEAFEASLKLDPEQKIVKDQLKNIVRRSGVKHQVEEKKRVLFLELPGIGHFLDHITENLKKKYHVKHIKTTEHEKIAEHINWADIVWLEWANEMAVYVTNKIPQIKSKTVICRLHGYEVFTDLPPQINWNVVDHLVFVARHKQEIFNNKFKVKSPFQTVVRNGVNTNEFTIAEKKRNTKRLVFLGHLNFRKGLHMLLQFFHQLLKHDPEYYLYIRGEFQDQRLEMSTHTMIRELSLMKNLEFVGWIDDLNAWLSDKSHILSFSIEESFHYAVGNGMAAGLKPVIHAWNESREIWPEDFIFNDIDGFINIMLDKQFDPHRYRKMLFDYSLDYAHQILAIDELFQKYSEKKPIPVQISNSELSIENQYEILERPSDIVKAGYFSGDTPLKMRKATNVENSASKLLSSEKQIFIGGTGRSGTTLLKEILNEHKDIASFGETKIFDVSRQFLEQLLTFKKSDRMREVNLFKYKWTNDLYYFKVPWSNQKDNGDRGLHMWFAKEEIQDCFPILDDLVHIQSHNEAYRVFGNFINHLFTTFSTRQNKPFWAEKTPSNAVQASFLGMCFGNMKLINVIRDGRDVACSLVKVPWGIKAPKKALDWWAANLLQAFQVQSTMPENSFLNVRYEDIVFETETTLKRVLKFLNIDWDDQLMEFEISAGSIGRYKKELSPEVQAYAKQKYGKLLEELQYSV